ncbi:hypothetical protein LguiA_029038 [Lonicera macranthoides]
MVTVPHPSHFSSAELGGHWGYNDEKSDNYQNVTNTVIAGAFPEFIAGQNCGCAADLYVVAYTVIAALPVITVPLGVRVALVLHHLLLMVFWWQIFPVRSSIGFDGLKKLEIVASDPVMSFRVPLWYWMNRMHSIITSSQGFGPTTRAINGQLECDGANHNIVTARVQYYIELCNLLGVFSQR